MGDKEYYQKNKERVLAQMKEYRDANQEAIRARKIDYRHRRTPQDILTKTRGQARVKGLEFNLELSDIVIPEMCPYLKVPLTRVYGQGRYWSNISIDRIDSTKGYVKGNIQFMTDLANRMKSSATIEQRVTFAKSVLELHGDNHEPAEAG